MAPPADRKDPRRPLLVGAVALLIAACVLFAFDSALTAWVALAGTVVLFLYFVVRRAALAQPSADRRESMLFGQTTTMEDSRDDPPDVPPR